jgi:ADP-heptose:LPS heptosyltransferase
VFEAPWMKRSPTGPTEEELIGRLRDERFDAAVIFTSFTQSPLPAALVCRLGGVPLRLAHCRENPYLLLSDWVRESEPEGGVRHETQRQLDLVASIGARTEDRRLRLDVPEAARRRAAELAPADESANPLVVVHPGGTASSRRYPPELWAEACRRLAEEEPVRLVFTGDAGERDLVKEVRAAAGSHGPSLAGRLDLSELVALVERATLVLTGNTGPAHLAAATGTPVVDLYALTNPQHTPWLVPSRVLFHDVPCRWCYRSVCPEGHHLCLRGVDPAAVVEAARSLLRGEPGGEPHLPVKAR